MHCIPTRDPCLAHPLAEHVEVQLPQFRKFSVPRWSRLLRAVEDLAVGGELFDARVLKAMRAKLLDDVFGSGAKSARATHAMMARDELQIALSRFARNLARENGDGRFGQ